MKKLLILVLFLAFVLSGCSVNKPSLSQEKTAVSPESIEEISSDNPETSAENKIIWQADLNHDGKEDKIVVEISNGSYEGEGAKISIYNNNTDLLIYSAQADLSHAGWDGFYLYSDENGGYLLNWRPTMYQGYGNYFYEIFSFNANGDKVVLDTDSIDFDSDVVRREYKGLEDFVIYIQKINNYLSKSPLIIDTDGGDLKYGKQDNYTINPYVPKWLFDIF